MWGEPAEREESGRIPERAAEEVFVGEGVRRRLEERAGQSAETRSLQPFAGKDVQQEWRPNQ